MVSIFVEKIEERPEKVLVEEEKKKETKRKKEKKEEKEKEEKREERMAGSTHNAFKVKQLLVDRLPETIESIETFDNYLIAGATSGTLIVFEVSQNMDSDSRTLIRPTKSYKGWSSKPITQLSADTRHRMLISICNGKVSLHRLNEVDKRIQELKNTSGCTCFAVDYSKPQLVLCVGLKKRVLIYQLTGSTLVEKRDLSISDIPKSLTWCGSSTICVAMRKEYVMLDFVRKQTNELFQNKGGVPTVTSLPRDQVLIGKDNTSLFQGFDGKPQRNYRITWSEVPQEVGYSFPYVLGLLSRDRGVEVRSIYDRSTTLTQTIPIKGLKLLCIREKENPFAAIEGISCSEIYLASPHQIWKLIPIPFFQQIDDLIKAKQFEEAELFCEQIPAEKNKKQSKLQQIKLENAYHLFCERGQFERALELFYQLEIPTVHVLSLFSNYLPSNMSVPSPPATARELVGETKDMAIKALIPYLGRVRNVLMEERKSIQEDKERERDEEYADVTDVLVIVDTSLLRAFMSLSMEGSIQKLLKKENYCHLKESETILRSHKQFKLVVALFCYHGQHKTALDLLQRIGARSAKDANETIDYLVGLGSKNQDIVLKYSTWVIKQHPEEALRIFTNDKDPIPPLVVLEHLKNHNPELAISYLEWAVKMYENKRKERARGRRGGGEEGAGAEVEAVEVELHNELIVQYLDIIKQLKHLEEDMSEQMVTDVGLLGITRQKLYAFLNSSEIYTPEKMFSRFPIDSLYEERAILHSKIGQHDEALSIYAYELGDYALAEKYCHNHYNENDETSKDVFLSLLKVYLHPPPEKEMMLEPALKLLKNYSSNIDTAKALTLLPPDVPLSHLHEYLCNVLRESSSKRRNGQIIRNLMKSEHLQLKEELIRVQSASVRVTTDRNCAVCDKRLGTSVFARYPNGVVVHLKCHKNNKHVCPSTGTRFDQPSSKFS